MKRKSFTQWSKQAIEKGLLELVSGKYESAEQHFSDVVNELRNRVDHYQPFDLYLRRAAFGQGLSQGLNERQILKEPRPISDTAIAAKHLYEAFLEFRGFPITPEKYKALGKSYAALGLEREGWKVLDFSQYGGRIDSILSICQICPKARKLSQKDLETEK